jgi:hypothetical protein
VNLTVSPAVISYVVGETTIRAIGDSGRGGAAAAAAVGATPAAARGRSNDIVGMGGEYEETTRPACPTLTPARWCQCWAHAELRAANRF